MEERPGGNGSGDDWFGGEEDWLEIDTAERDAIRRERRELEKAARKGWEDPSEETPDPTGDELQEALQVGAHEPEPSPGPDTGSETGERRRLRDDPFTPARVPVPGGCGARRARARGPG